MMQPDEESRDKMAAEGCTGPIQMDKDKRLSADLASNQPEEIPCPSPSKKQLPTSTTGAPASRQRPKQTGLNKRRHLTELGPPKGTAARQLASTIGGEQPRRSGQQSLNTPHPAKLSSQQRRPRRKGLKLAPTTGSNLNGSRKNGALLATLMGTANSEIAQQMDQNCEQKSNPPHSNQSVYVCSGCQKPIRERYLFRACDKFWHNRCLKCDRCQAKLGELGSSFYLVGEMNLCRQDYYEMFAHKAICAVCDKLIYASEMVMRARDNVYHLECFACQLCGLRFCVGDRFHLCENKIVCQFDYDEHIYPIQQQHYAQFNSQTGFQLDLVPMQPIDGTQQEPVGGLPLGPQLIHDGTIEQQQAEFNGLNEANCHEALVFHTMELGSATELVSGASAEQTKSATPQQLHDHDTGPGGGSDKTHAPEGGSPADEIETRREPIPEAGSG